MMPLIRLDRIGRCYGGSDAPVQALSDVSLEIVAGDSVAIMGPSGSGKSTLLGILGCLDTPSSGSYLLREEEVGRMSKPELAELRCRRFGFVFQNFNLLPRLTALENVELPLAYARQRPGLRRAKATTALRLVGLADRMSHYPNQLSGGQQQRVAIARALVNEPDLILADEPTGALDTMTGREILSLLDEVNAAGTTVVIVTHDRDIAETMRRTITLTDGRITSDLRAEPHPDSKSPIWAGFP
ncbi:ABC transporter ATP-binding protein [Ensifer sp. NBAIM29]|nr:ABC transporter ATP-binding protein [Ensifer sp. NBAIM29]